MNFEPRVNIHLSMIKAVLFYHQASLSTRNPEQITSVNSQGSTYQNNFLVKYVNVLYTLEDNFSEARLVGEI